MEQKSAMAFMDILGTTYFAQYDPPMYSENLNHFKRAVNSRSSLLKNAGKVFLFSDCAYVGCSSPQILVDYLTEVRRYLLARHLYLQAAIEPGELEPSDAREGSGDIVFGTTFGSKVAPLFARQHALKGAAVRVSNTLMSDNSLKESSCVMSCHLPNPTNSLAECFLDIRYPEAQITRERLEDVLSDCMRAKAGKRSAGSYYVSVLISMIRSVDWTSVNLDKQGNHNNTSARHLYDLLIKEPFGRHFGDLRGVEYIFFTMLDEVYRTCEGKPVFDKIRSYIAARPRLMRRIEVLPADLLSHKNRQKFLASTMVWSRFSRNAPKIKLPTKKKRP
jgi:hypothetical protein